MDKLYYSKDNYQLLQDVVNETVIVKHKFNPNGRYNNMLFNIMEFVFTKSGPTPPNGKSFEDYNQILNKRVLSLIIPRIDHEIINSVKKTRQPVPKYKPPVSLKQSRDINQSRIQARTLNEESIIMNIPKYQKAVEMPMPVSQNQIKKEINLNANFERLEEKRRDLQPKAPFNNSTFQNEIERKNREMTNKIKRQVIYPSSMDGPQPQIKSLLDTKSQPDTKSDTKSQSDTISQIITQNINMTIDPVQNSNDDNKTIENFANRATLINEIKNNKLFSNVNSTMTNLMDKSTVMPTPGANYHELFYESDRINKQELDEINNMNLNVDSSFPVINPPLQKYIKMVHHISIDSRDRDLEVYPQPNYFQVKFAPAGDTTVMKEYYDKNGIHMYSGNVKIFGDDKGASIDIKYDNVLSLECIQATVPFTESYICGTCPDKYNNGLVDQNKTIGVDGQFNSYRFGPIYDSRVGLKKNVLDEPYLLLVIDEIENGPYKGTNKASTVAFSKLFNDRYFGLIDTFIQLKTNGYEKKMYEPMALGRIDKLTIGLRKWNNLLYDFGTDKIHIESFSKGCNNTTIIKILTNHHDYGNDGYIDNHCLRPGALIYIYDTKLPKNCQDIMTFTNKTKITLIANDDNKLELRGFIDTKQEMVINNMLIDINVDTSDYIKINFRDFLNEYDSIYLKYTIDAEIDNLNQEHEEYLQIISFTENGIIIDNPCNGTILTISKFGFIKTNKKGILSNNRHDINYIDGIRVCNILDSYSFEIDYPYSQMSKSQLSGELFFIKHNLQINYTFRIVTLEKDISIIQSQIAN